RGARSYELALAKAVRKYGRGSYSLSLALYRQLFHFAGSLIVIYGATIIVHYTLGEPAALVFLLFLVTIGITYQEFFFQRKHYSQHWTKGIADWLVWVAPFWVYCVYFVY